MRHFNKPYSCNLLAGILIWFVVITANSQTLPAHGVEVTMNKTSSIVFPVSIASVDRGSRDVLAQKAKGVTNVLQIKAGRAGFQDTNLTVITTDGRLHHFLIHYEDQPATFITMMTDSSDRLTLPLLFDSGMTEVELETTSSDILANSHNGSLEKDSNADMKLMLKGIYIHNNILFFHLKVVNKSHISFHSEMLRFSVKDKKKIKRMASQEVTEVPVHITGDLQEIAGKSSTQLVYAIPKFTIPDAKLLRIELVEKRGGRHLYLSVKNKTIVRARSILK